MPSFLQQVRNQPAPAALGMLAKISYPQFLVALVAVTLLGYLITFFYQRFPQRQWPLYLLLTLQTTVFINIFSHIAASIHYKTYSPGIMTALSLNLPFSIILFLWGKNNLHLKRKDLLLILGGGFFFHGPVLLGLMALAGIVT